MGIQLGRRRRQLRAPSVFQLVQIAEEASDYQTEAGGECGSYGCGD
jgi:hypothetical protein